MTFKQQLQTDLSVFLNTDEFAETVTYTQGVNIYQIPAIVDRGGSLENTRKRTKSSCVLHIKKSDLTRPLYNDTLDLDADTWRVERIASGDGFVWQVEARKDAAAKFK